MRFNSKIARTDEYLQNIFHLALLHLESNPKDDAKGKNVVNDVNSKSNYSTPAYI